MIISIDATQGAEKFWEEINEAHEAIMKAKKPSLWQELNLGSKPKGPTGTDNKYSPARESGGMVYGSRLTEAP